MDRLLTSLEAIDADLTKLGVRHALVGGMAVSAWGKARLTKDLDIKVDVPREGLHEFRKRLPVRYRPLSPEALAAAHDGDVNHDW